MWTAEPKHWFSWDFVIRDTTREPVAEVRLSSWRECGAIEIAGVEHKVSRRGMLGAFVVETGDSVVASAEKPSAFRGTFQIEYEAQHYTLRKESMWLRELVFSFCDCS